MSFYRKNYRPRRDGEEPEKCADPAKARARALDALAAREMTSGQLYERLCVRFTEQAAAEAVAEMVELDYVNDDRYAEAKAHSLLAARKSRRAAAQNLRQKGLNAQQIEQALESVYAPDEDGESPELEAAAALVRSRYKNKLAAGRRRLRCFCTFFIRTDIFNQYPTCSNHIKYCIILYLIKLYNTVSQYPAFWRILDLLQYFRSS